MKKMSENNGPTVTYVLFAHVNGRRVFEGTYPDTFEVQEEGLTQAENDVEHALGLSNTDLEPEEINYVRSRGILYE